MEAKKDFGQVFTEAVDKLTEDAKEAGVPLSEVCSEVGLSRATPSRWKRKLPLTIQRIKDMQEAVGRVKARRSTESPAG